MRTVPRRRALLGAAAITLLALSLTSCAAGAHGDGPSSGELRGPLQVYAAASLSGAFDAIGAAFESEHPAIDVTAVYDGSSTLVTQILEGAPADVFAAADEATAARAGELALDPHVFATNTLVIAVPAGNPASVADLADLADVTTVLCAPEVPCGAAAAALLEEAGVDVTPASIEQNVTAVLTKVSAGEADAGLVYATDARGAEAVDAIVPEGAADVVNRYPITALADAPNPDAAAAFVAFVQSETARAILADRGFGAP